jgi:hypothetical protein
MALTCRSSLAFSQIERELVYPTSSALHRALGLPQRQLEFDDVAKAASNQLPESGELDWKAELPKYDGGPSEFAKDVTAFANAAGGLLIYGVTDNGHVKGIQAPNVDAEINRLQQQLASRVRPYLVSIEYQTLVNADKTLLLVHVPASAAAPHLVYEQNAVADAKRPSVVPLRVNTRTEFLDERQLAEAYRRRFQLTEDRRLRVAGLAAFATEQMMLLAPKSAWLTLVATPVMPELREPIGRHEVLRLATDALQRASAMFNDPSGSRTVLNALPQAAVQNPRVGLRCWVASNSVADADRNDERPTYVEVHHDGSTVLVVNASWNVNNTTAEQATVISSQLVDDAALEFVALASLTADKQSPGSELLLQATITVAESNKPFAAIDTASGSSFERQWSRRVPRVQPATTSMLPSPSVDDLRLVAYELASGVVNQFGLDSYLVRPSRG